jgi:hypothetical protein
MPIINGNSASAQLVLQGKPTLISLNFLHEPTGWKIDLEPTLLMTDQMMAIVTGMKKQP